MSPFIIYDITNFSNPYYITLCQAIHTHTLSSSVTNNSMRDV